MLPGRASSYWFPQVLRGELLVVRTHNHLGRYKEEYPDPYVIRQDRAARKFHENWPYSIGFIGSQEVNDIECFRTSIEGYYKASASAIHEKNPGIVVGAPWMIAASAVWTISKHTRWKVGMPFWENYHRYLLEAKLENAKNGYSLRFYSTHLTPGNEKVDNDERRNEVDNVIRIVLKQAQPGELPPIVVGDFNAGKDDAEIEKMHQHFHIINDSSVDLIWVGRLTSFPMCKGSYVLVSTDTVYLTTAKCSDHNSPSAGLAIRLV
jgi:hypothetical protein